MDKKIKGFKDFMKTPRQVPAPPGGHPVPPGYKRVKDHIAGWKLVKVDENVEVSEGILGALGGAVLGLAAGGPIGAVVGGIAGHRIQDQAKKNPSLLDAAILRGASKLAKRTIGPGTISRALALRAAKKSGFDVVSPEYGGSDRASRRPRPTQRTAPAAPAPTATPAPVQHEINPEHTPGHPGHGEVPSPFLPRAHETEAGQELAARRKAAQQAVMQRAQERANAALAAQEAMRNRKRETPTSSTLIIP